jgi:hypothetical protein
MGRAAAPAPLGMAALATSAALLACAGAGAGRARLSLRCPDPGAEVSVDGVPRGLVSDYRGGEGHQLLLAPGVHRLLLRGTLGASAARELSVGPEDQITLGVDLPAPAGTGASGGWR